MAIALDLLEPVFEQTKKLFFPVRKEFWLKIGFVSLMSGGPGSGGNFGRGVGDGLNTAGFDLAAFIQKYILYIIIGVGVLAAAGIAWFAISIIFSYIFIESLILSQVTIKKSFQANLGRGLSFFMLFFMISALNLLVMILLALPLIITLLGNLNDLSIDDFSIPYIIFFALIFILDIILMLFVRFFLSNFVFNDLYLSKGENSRASFKKMWNLVCRERKQVFVYLMMRIALSLGVAAIAILIALVMLIPGLLLAAIIFLLVLAVIAIPAMAAKIALGALTAMLALAFFIAWIYAIAVLTSPLKGFMSLYAYRFVEELSKKNSNLMGR